MTRCNVVSWVVLGEDSYIMHMEAVVMMWDDFSKAGWLPREVAQSCPTLCNPMNCSLPGSSIHRIFQARILEWVAFPSPGDLPDPGIEPRSPALQADTYHLSYQGSLREKVNKLHCWYIPFYTLSKFFLFSPFTKLVRNAQRYIFRSFQKKKKK